MTTVSDRRGEKPHKPDDGQPECDYCNSMRWVIGTDGKLKVCPLCGSELQRKLDNHRKYNAQYPDTQE